MFNFLRRKKKKDVPQLRPRTNYSPPINRVETINPIDVVAGAVILDSILHEHTEPPCPHHDEFVHSFEGGESGGGGATRDFDTDAGDSCSYDGSDSDSDCGGGYDSGDSGGGFD